MKDDAVRNKIYEKIKNQIMNKHVFPGSRIVEDDIAKESNVSRAVVRSVLSRLQSEGFIRIIPNKGACVTKPTIEEMQNTYHVRLSLELGAASLAVKNISEEAIARMEENYTKQVQLKGAFSEIEYAKLNRDFHWEIALASKNDYYIKYLNEMLNIVHIYLVFFDAAHDNTVSLSTHRMILDALKERDESKLLGAIRLDQQNGMQNLEDKTFID